MKQTLNIWFDRVKNSQTLIMGGSAFLVGLASGVGVWIFKRLIDVVNGLTFGNLANITSPLGKWTIVLVPVLGGLIVGLINHFFLGEEKVHGTAGIMQSVALTGGRLHYQSTPLKTLAAIVSIGTGASVGPEDPSVQIGASLGSFLAQKIHTSDDRIRILVSAGAASAIASAFNAPIAGVFFALELVLGELGSNSLGMILLAAVTSSVFTQAVSGSSPAFQVPPYAFNSAWELPFYLVLGLLAGPVSAIYARLLYIIQDFYNNWSIPRWVKPASSGLVVGVVGVFLPQLFGVGYETIGEILKNNLTLWVLLALLVGKVILTPVNIGGGFLGGVFAPALFIGAALGGAFGTIINQLFPGMGLSPSAFAMVGMAAVLAGSVRAPLTAVILPFEMTNDYRIILPLMFAVAVSLVISQRIQNDSVYAMGLARHGVRLDRGRDVEVMQAVTVGEAMQLNMGVLQENISVNDAADILMHTRHHGLPVVDEHGLLTGILTVQDIERSVKNATVGQACTHNIETAYPDETLSIAIRRMSLRDLGRLPVVSRDNPRKLVGVLRRADVIRAYNIALTRRTEQRHHEQAIRLDAMTPVRMDVTDVTVERNAPCVGKTMSEIPFPHDSVIASVRRGRQVFIPRGNTELLAGDILVVVANDEALKEVFRLCREVEKLI